MLGLIARLFALPTKGVIAQGARQDVVYMGDMGFRPDTLRAMVAAGSGSAQSVKRRKTGTSEASNFRDAVRQHQLIDQVVQTSETFFR